MVNPVDIGLRIAQALDGIGIKMGSYIGKSSNVKKAMFGGKSTMFKPNAIQSLRGEGKNFEDALKLIEEEAQFIVNASDAEKMAFLNNLNDYKELGGPLKKDFVASKQFEEGIGSLKDDVESLQTTAKTMKEDAEKGLKSAEEDLKTFLETGGNPLKKKEPKYLGGSMHEEGQLRTAIRTFLRNEYKNGRIKLDKDDQFRIMEYSPMMEDDPIKVFKKIYGDEAYKRAGTFPGAFETGESFNHYESIFKNKMGEDILKVKDKKYVGDGKLILTKQEEVVTPTPDDDDIPFAEGGRASFGLGGPPKMVKGVMEIIKMIKTKMSPMGAMKEVNKVIGKKGEYSNLTQKDIDEIVEKTEDFIFQRDPDDLYVGGKDINKSVDDMSLEESLTTLEGLGGTKMAERFRLKQKYPGLDDDLLTSIIEDTDPMHKASVLAKIDMAMELGKTNKSADEIIEILKSEPETKMATGGRAGFYMGGQSGQSVIEPDLSDIGHGSDALMSRTRLSAPGSQATTSTGLNYLLGEDNDNTRVPFRFGGKGPGKVLQDQKKLNQMMENFLIKEAPYGILTPRPKNLNIENLNTADRPPKPEFKIGPYDPQSDINPFSKNNVVEFDDGTFMYKDNGMYFKIDEEDEPYEVPGPSKGAKIKPIEMEAAEGGRAGFNKGLLVPPSKPYTPDMFEKDSMTLLKGMYGTGKDSNEFLYNEMIKKGNKLREQGVERETVIEIIRNNKDKINAFLETQTTSPKSLKGLADGGRINFQDGLNFDKAFEKILEQETKEDVNMLEEGENALIKKLDSYVPNETEKEKEEREMFDMVKEFQTLKKNKRILPDMSFQNFKKMKTLTNLKNKILELNVKYPEKKIINDQGMVDTENLKSAIDQAQADLEISPIDGLKLKRSINTEGEQSVTSGSFDIGNLNFSSDNIEEGKLTSKGDFTFGGIDLSGMVNSNDGQILNTELGFNYDNALKGKMTNSDGYRSTELDLNKTFPINDKFNLNLKGGANTQTFDGKTYRSSDLTPKLSYNDGIFNASIAKEIMDGGDGLNLGAGVNYNNFYAKGDNLLSEDRSGVLGYQKEFGNKDGDLFFTAGAEKNIFDDEYTGGVGFKYKFADGGITGLRQGYVGGGGVNLARRGFLKVLGATAAGVAAFKTGALKLLGKTATTKVAPKLFTAAEGSGAPAWFEGMVNKVLADGVDITKKAATMDGQTVKSLDTPTGKVDVTIDRTGNIDVNYMGDNTAMGEGVDMRYVVGQADEMTKVKPFDEFEAVENIPEGQMSSPNDYNVEFTENATDNVKNLYSDTSELAELGGQKPLIKDISTTIKKKQTLKKMNENPDQFASDNLRDDFPNYDYDDVNPDYD